MMSPTDVFWPRIVSLPAPPMQGRRDVPGERREVDHVVAAVAVGADAGHAAEVREPALGDDRGAEAEGEDADEVRPVVALDVQEAARTWKMLTAIRLRFSSTSAVNCLRRRGAFLLASLPREPKPVFRKRRIMMLSPG